jgi:hypothetical protein
VILWGGLFVLFYFFAVRKTFQIKPQGEVQR